MDLLTEIENKRLEMVKLAREKGLSAPEVLKVSEELDRLLNLYQRVEENAC